MMKRSKNRLSGTIRIHQTQDTLWEDMRPEAFAVLRGSWRPLYDLFITRDQLVLIIEVPGVEKNDIGLSISPRGVLVQGRRTAAKVVNEGKVFYNLEIPYGRFERRIPFPIEVRVKDVEVNLANGLLTMVFPLTVQDVERIITVEDG
jgi:HSP20 family protein